MSIDYLREMLGTEIEAEQTIQPVPVPHPDAVDSHDNISKYALAKPVLEHPMVNPILAEMQVLETLNPYNMESYYNMARWITEALTEFAEENADTPQSIDFNKEFSIQSTNEGLNSFSEEFLIEFTKSRFMGSPPNGESEMGGGMDREMGGGMDIPPQAGGWMDKLASKFGIDNLGIKDFIYMYILKKYHDKKSEMTDTRPTPQTPSQTSAFPSPGAVNEGQMVLMMEGLPAGMKGWIQSIEARYQKEHGEDWKKELYATAFKKLKNRNDAIGANESVEDDAEKQMITDDKVKEGVEDVHGGADTPDHVENCKDRKGPVASSKVKSDIKQRIKELDDLIKTYRSEEHFGWEIKPAIFNTKTSLELIQDKIADGGLCAYKEAQIHYQTLMSPITNLFPPTLIKFLAYGNDGEESKVMKPVEN